MQHELITLHCLTQVEQHTSPFELSQVDTLVSTPLPHRRPRALHVHAGQLQDGEHQIASSVYGCSGSDSALGYRLNCDITDAAARSARPKARSCAGYPQAKAAAERLSCTGGQLRTQVQARDGRQHPGSPPRPNPPRHHRGVRPDNVSLLKHPLSLQCSSPGSPDVRFRTFLLGVYRYTKYHNDKNRAAELF
jgi:hypothetical protein